MISVRYSDVPVEPWEAHLVQLTKLCKRLFLTNLVSLGLARNKLVFLW
jgi:hypothetical protein